MQPSPADAVEVLKADRSPADMTDVQFYRDAAGPTAVVIASGPTAGPWDWPKPAPARRLDGTLLSEPVTTYGAAPLYPSIDLLRFNDLLRIEHAARTRR